MTYIKQYGLKALLLTVLSISFGLSVWNTYRVSTLYTFFQNGDYQKSVVYILQEAVKQAQGEEQQTLP